MAAQTVLQGEAQARRRPEVELLLCCARAHLDSGMAARARALAGSELDWGYLVQLADRHGLQPLLYHHLRQTCAATIPQPFEQRLREAAQRVSALNIFLTRELQRLLTSLAAAGIEALPYKGPALAETLYGNVALRQFSDLDILVPARSIKGARAILLAAGYTPLPPLTDTQQAVLLRTQCNLPFTRDEHRLVVELHWAVSAHNFARPFAADELWTRAVAGELDGFKIKRPAAEDLLLALCVHGSKHLWERLAWVCDVAELVKRQPGLKWAELLAAARATGSERMLFTGLRLAAELLAAPLPAQVQQALDEDAVSATLAARVVRTSFTPALTPSGVSGYFRFQLKARRRLRDKLKYLRFVITPTEEDLVQLKLPAPLSFVYYLVRPIRLLMTGGPAHFH